MEEKKITLSSDRPESVENFDKLGRREFVEEIAEYIRYLPLDEGGFTAALYGKWGEGKTTVINFLKHYLAHKEKSDHETKVKIIDFEPWMYQDQITLAQAFLKEISSALNVPSDSDSNKKIKKAFKALSASQSQSSFFVSFSVFGVNLGIRKEIFNIKHPFSKEKKELIDVLKSKIFNNKRILVIVDDLDRCLPNEILNTLRIIKAVCDFPRLFFLISCDHERVARAVGNIFQVEDTEKEGKKYLEKIVQHEFNLPEISGASSYFLPFIIKEIIEKNFPDYNSFSDNDILQSYFYVSRQEIDEILYLVGKDIKNLRDIYRFRNKLIVKINLCRSCKTYVNLADLIGVEACSFLFGKNLYNYKDNYKIRKIDNIPEAVKQNLEIRRNSSIIEDFLFPNVNDLNEYMRSNFRINTDKYFDNYFHFINQQPYSHGKSQAI